MEKKMEEQKTMKQINLKKKKKAHKSANEPHTRQGKSAEKNKKGNNIKEKTAGGVQNVPAMKKKGQTPSGKPGSGGGNKEFLQKGKKIEPKKTGGSHGNVRKDGTVSFMDEDDAVRQSKKQRKVQLSAKRAAEQRAGHKRRANVPGSRAPKDA
jgi:hypothetical protein